jgi:hypothetical protein
MADALLALASAKQGAGTPLRGLCWSTLGTLCKAGLLADLESALAALPGACAVRTPGAAEAAAAVLSADRRAAESAGLMQAAAELMRSADPVELRGLGLALLGMDTAGIILEQGENSGEDSGALPEAWAWLAEHGDPAAERQLNLLARGALLACCGWGLHGTGGVRLRPHTSHHYKHIQGRHRVACRRRLDAATHRGGAWRAGEVVPRWS